VTAQAEAEQPPAAPPQPAALAPPEPQPQPEPAIQIIRAGSGCLACPGERQPIETQAPSVQSRPHHR
jgi:hypothetical protein